MITVIGAGALGSLVAAYLSWGEKDVILLDSDDNRIQEIRDNGVRTVGFRGARNFQVEAKPMTELASLTPLQTVCLCVKPDRLDEVLDEVLPLSTADTVFVSLMGGFAPFSLAERTGTDRTVVAIANIECALLDNGLVENDFDNFIWMGELNNKFSERLERLQIDLSWLAPTFVTSVIQGQIWGKALFSLQAALVTLSDARPLEVFRKKNNRDLAAALVRENLDVADASGIQAIPFDYFDPNMYRAETPGEGKVMDIWTRNAWFRHEKFKDGVDGIEHDFPEQAGLMSGLTPKNPEEETSRLVQDLNDQADRVGMKVQLTEAFLDIFLEVKDGVRKQGQANLDDLYQRMLELNMRVPGMA